ncbi:MAG: DMT family transporter [Anaerolineae bacterium]
MPLETYLGEIAGVITAFFWACTSIFFTLAGQELGSRAVNRLRLLLAVPFLALIHLFAQGTLLPLNASPARWTWLSLSALAGLVIGDGLLFYAFTQIGARLSMLLMALNPIIGALLAWGFLGERLQPGELTGVVLSVTGVAWVVSEPRRRPRSISAKAASGTVASPDRTYLLGVLCALGAATGQAVGLVLSKQGMRGGFPTLSASLMRVLAATLFLWIGAALRGEARASFLALQQRRALGFVVGGTLVGPVFGMTLSLVAVQFSQVGVASTLMALSPLLMLPLSHWIFGERITGRAVGGTLLAMLGVALLFTR